MYNPMASGRAGVLLFAVLMATVAMYFGTWRSQRVRQERIYFAGRRVRNSV
jgi:preprotein translocase subunit YajC